MSDTNLLYENAVKPPEKKGLLIISVLVLLFIVIALSVYVFFFGTEKEVVSEAEVQKQQIIAELTKDANTMTALYNSERGAVAPEGKDAQNYGLEEETTGTPLAGRLIFSGSKKGGTDSTNIYTFNIEDSKPPQVLIPNIRVSAMAEFSDTTADDKLFFITETALESDGLGVHSYDMKTGEIVSFTSAQGFGERNVVWSESAGLLAFNRQSGDVEHYVDMLPIENWEIVIINPETDELIATIDNAFRPQWSPDGTQILFLKKDGLYLYDLATKESRNVALVEQGEVITTSLFDVSYDGKHLVWTTPKAGLITVSTITSWSPFEIVEEGRITMSETEFYWPVFSPDGAHYAVQAIEALQDGEYVRKNPRIEIRETLNREVRYVYALDDFVFNALFGDTWVLAPQE